MCVLLDQSLCRLNRKPQKSCQRKRCQVSPNTNTSMVAWIWWERRSSLCIQVSLWTWIMICQPGCHLWLTSELAVCRFWLHEHKRAQFHQQYCWHITLSSRMLTAGYVCSLKYRIYESMLTVFIWYVPLMWVATGPTGRIWFMRVQDSGFPSLLADLGWLKQICKDSYISVVK